MSKLVILCSGQGRQYPAMFEHLRDYPEAQALESIIRAAAVLPAECGNPDLWFRNDLAQPLICQYQMMIWEVIRPLLPETDIFAGYSLGELSAFGCAGIFAPAELVRLAASRGRLMTDAASEVPQTMAAVLGLRREEIDVLAAKFDAYVAIINAPTHFILGLPAGKVDLFLAAASLAGAEHVVHLPVTVASHTPYMSRAAEAFNEVLLKSEYKVSEKNVLSGMNGGKIFSRSQMIAGLTAQIHRTIDWQACMEGALSYGGRVFLELGPGDSLTRMLRQAFPDVEARAMSEFRDLHSAGKWANNRVLLS